MIIFDLDGTLSLNGHRAHLAKQKKWDEFFDLCHLDEGNQQVIRMFDLLCLQHCQYGGPEVQIWSGRVERTRDKTVEWLGRHTEYGARIGGPRLRMRPDGDYTPDVDLKRAWLMEVGPTNVELVFDDRDSVVYMWRSHGVTCFQVAPGSF